MTNSKSSRSDSTELPSAVELIDILGDESQRKAVEYDYLQNHSSFFDAHKRLSQLAGSEDTWIDTFETMDLDTLVQSINKNHAELKTFIENNPDQADLYEEMYNKLVPADQLEPSDAIFVFGAASNARIERAVELYSDGVANKIIISGNRPFYSENQESEAERMAAYAMANGVPEADLLLEKVSITLPDNVKRTIDLLDDIDW